MTSRLIDISLPLRDGMICWPGDPVPHVTRAQDMGRGDRLNVTRLDMAAHSGTHLDAPLHFLRRGESIDQMPLDATVGPARVLPIANPEAVTAEELAGWDIQRGERILLRTANSARDWWEEPFCEQFVYIAADGARHLAERGVKSVGIDYLSVDGFDRDLNETHKTLLGAGVWVIESLDLTRVEPGQYELICLPLRLMGADGAPARALLRPLA